MKKNLFYLFALICSMSLFTACSDDDKPGGGGEGGVTLEEVITNDIAGNYKGDLAVTVLGVPMEPVAQKVAVTKSGTEAVSLSINNFSFLGMSLGDIKLENCALAEENGAYTFTGTTSLNVTPVPGMNLTADVAAEGSFTTGNPTSITLNLDIKAELAGQQQDVTVVYTGTRLTGNESSEALITSFAIDSELVSEAPVIDNEAGTITFKVLDSAESLVFAPTIEVSAGATVSPASGEEQDFSSAVTYTVTAEDGTVKTYTVSVAAKQSVLAYSFDKFHRLGKSFIGYLVFFLICFIGAYSTSNSMFGVVIMIIGGFLGYIFSKCGLPTAPLLLAFVLSSTLETNLRRAFLTSHGNIAVFLERPITDVFLVIFLIMVLVPVGRAIYKKVKANK